jgi:hypothetical protein
MEERESGQQILTRATLAARVLATGSARSAGGIVARQRVQPSK